MLPRQSPPPHRNSDSQLPGEIPMLESKVRLIANACVRSLQGDHRPWIPAKPVKEVGEGSSRKEKELDGARRAGVDSQPGLQAGAGLNLFPLKRRAPFPERQRMAQSPRRLHAHLGVRSKLCVH